MDSLIPRAEYAALERFNYLNQAALGLIPAASTAAMTAFLQEVAQYGNVRLSDEQEALVLEDLRSAAAALLDAPTASVAITGGASEALGQVAALLSGRKGTVVLVSSDFPSVTYPWLVERQRYGTRLVPVEDIPGRDLTQALVDAIDESVKVVCFSAVQFATGTSVDVAAVVARARQAGARVVVDATQLVGAGPVSVRDWGADAVVCSGYKWLSAHGGVALLALAPDLLDRVPGLVGWKSTRSPFAFEPMGLPLAEDARRFELSTIAYVSAVGLHRSIDLLAQAGPDAIATHARKLATDLETRAAPLGWSPFRPLADPGASGHLVAMRHPLVPAEQAQRTLAEEHGIICSARNGALRVSLHAYNNTHDTDALIAALAALCPGRPKTS